MLRSATGAVCAINVDRLPLLLCDRSGSVVAAAQRAGWRGITGWCAGNTVAAMHRPGGEILFISVRAIRPGRV